MVHVCRAASESPYRILGVAPSASEADIKRAYRRLALRFHPDVNKEPDAQQRFMSIKSAYQKLIDSNSHLSVDQSRKPDPFSWGYSTVGEEGPNEFVDLGGVWEDVQHSFEEFFDDLQASFNNISAANKPRSLWEELADIGEEFVEFLEKELNFVNDIKQVIEEDEDSSGFKPSREGKSNTKEEARKLEIEINEIEEMLAKLKQDLGL
ncbi:hypothetical protein GOP47_0017837 [Adiantum capillus-veneris]|uniref:J domain-containing protein n=1 Tax=Adiantum capillus-veneris TaxID=13818 RepID=A0A9D4UG61_ADICA|nr:hypothetical protein GOP47_0017837 [Adiantum capillus-veneris]